MHGDRDRPRAPPWLALLFVPVLLVLAFGPVGLFAMLLALPIAGWMIWSRRRAEAALPVGPMYVTAGEMHVVIRTLKPGDEPTGEPRFDVIARDLRAGDLFAYRRLDPSDALDEFARGLAERVPAERVPAERAGTVTYRGDGGDPRSVRLEIVVAVTHATRTVSPQTPDVEEIRALLTRLAEHRSTKWVRQVVPAEPGATISEGDARALYRELQPLSTPT